MVRPTDAKVREALTVYANKLTDAQREASCIEGFVEKFNTRRTGNQLDVRNRLRKGSLKLSGEVQAAEDGLSKSLNRGTALGPIGEAMRITYGELSAMDIDGSNDNKKIRSAGRIAIKLVSEIKEAVRETMNRVRSASFDNLKKQPKPKVQKAGR